MCRTSERLLRDDSPPPCVIHFDDTAPPSSSNPAGLVASPATYAPPAPPGPDRWHRELLVHVLKSHGAGCAAPPLGTRRFSARDRGADRRAARRRPTRVAR